MLPRYVVESQKSSTDAASAFAATLFVRALLSAVFPLFTRQLFEKLGNNTAGSVLAAIATAFCILPIILIRFGATLRAGRSPSGRTPDDDSIDNDESGREIPVEKAPKPKKTVRWDDETDVSNNDNDDDGSEMTKSESPSIMMADTESVADSNLSSTNTMVPETEAESAAMERTERQSRSEERRDVVSSEDDARGGVERLGEGDGAGGAGGCSAGSKKEEEQKEKEKGKEEKGKNDQRKKRTEKIEKKETRKDADDRDDNLAGFLGVGFERLAVFPFF